MYVYDNHLTLHICIFQQKPHTADSIAEKMRLQKVQEDADLALSKDLFGGYMR